LPQCERTVHRAKKTTEGKNSGGQNGGKTAFGIFIQNRGELGIPEFPNQIICCIHYCIRADSTGARNRSGRARRVEGGGPRSKPAYEGKSARGIYKCREQFGKKRIIPEFRIYESWNKGKVGPGEP